MNNYNFWFMAGAAAIWLALCMFPAVWKFISHGVTLVHEAGHAIIGLLTGRGITHIKIRMDTSGETMDGGRISPIPFAHTIALLMGYPAPVILGTFLLASINTPWTGTAFFAATAIGIMTLIFIRNFWGFLTTLVWIASMGSVAALNPTAQNPAVYFIALFLIVGGLRDIYGLCRMYRHGVSGETDLGILQRHIFLPKIVSLVLIIGIATIVPFFMFQAIAFPS